MSKFKSGDVVVLKKDFGYIKRGSIAIVIETIADCVKVSFNDFPDKKYEVRENMFTIYTPKFKTGDRVELVNANFERYGGGIHAGVFDAHKRYRGTVLYLTGILVAVRFDDFHNGWSHGRNNNKDCYFVSGTNLKRIKKEKYKFNIGDRVKCSEANYSMYNNYGTIINISKGVSDIFYLVEFDTSFSFFHDGNVGTAVLLKGKQNGKPHHCWYLKDCDLEKLNIISDGFNTYDADLIMA